jgi:UDP-GlcNAc3NAcA epimerase
MPHILTIVGARPQFVKAAVVSKAFSDFGISEEIIHTGQHYDHDMSTVFWEELGIPAPNINLGVGSGPHGAQTGLMLHKIEAYLLELPDLPDALLVYGDTNSTLAGALVASKLDIPVIHVEAGLRSFNREMPEEINRIVTDHVSGLLFCSSEEGVNQLKKEGIEKNVYNVGDVMQDSFEIFGEIAASKYSLHDFIPFKSDEYYLATIHRPSNTDNETHLQNILNAFSALDKPVVWPVHPRNKARLNTLNLPENLLVISPLSYFKMNLAIQNCCKVLTDSGGLQKEAYWAKKPCITIRNETEWVETLEGGWNQLTGVDTKIILNTVYNQPYSKWVPLYGSGNAAKNIATVIQGCFS